MTPYEVHDCFDIRMVKLSVLVGTSLCWMLWAGASGREGRESRWHVSDALERFYCGLIGFKRLETRTCCVVVQE